ncbi:hypothetical protein ABLE91_28340 [Aquabacter sp. CN5-332]|uniref:hypothetical protein n=1 Tax=Aquabacter sp. CN5-332 TaxID=3156608 RepID=UPI0032B39C24
MERRGNLTFPDFSDPQELTAELERQRILEISGWWLKITCGGCGSASGYPLRLMCARPRRGGEAASSMTTSA